MTSAELQARRKSLGLSQPQMAQALLVSVRTYQGWEAGRPFPAYLELALREVERTLKRKAISGANTYEGECQHCGQVKASGDFTAAPQNRLFYQWCNECRCLMPHCIDMTHTIAAHRKRAAEFGAPMNDFSQADWLEILVKSGGKCFHCGEDVGYRKLTIEHLIPLCQGGNNTKSNIAAACRKCNKTPTGKRRIKRGG